MSGPLHSGFWGALMILFIYPFGKRIRIVAPTAHVGSVLSLTSNFIAGEALVSLLSPFHLRAGSDRWGRIHAGRGAARSGCVHHPHNDTHPSLHLRTHLPLIVAGVLSVLCAAFRDWCQAREEGRMIAELPGVPCRAAARFSLAFGRMPRKGKPVPGTLRWGILGPGFISTKQTEDLIGNGFAVSAVGSRSDASAREFADRFGIRTAHGSYRELVNDPDVDIVYIGTPHSLHYEQVRLALEAGKHVLVEKAFTVTAEQAAVLVELAEVSGLVLLEAMWTRFLPHMMRIREVIAAGTIGEVRTLIADHNQKLPTDPAHRLNDPALAGGALLDLGIYPVSFAWDLFGPPATIHASASMSATGVDRQTAIILGYKSGAQAVLHTALDTSGPNTATILGCDGWIAIDSVWYAPTGFTVFDSAGAVIERFDQKVTPRGMQFQAAELERLVEAGLTAGTVLPPAETVAIMGTLDAIRNQIGLEYPADIINV